MSTYMYVHVNVSNIVIIILIWPESVQKRPNRHLISDIMILRIVTSLDLTLVFIQLLNISLEHSRMIYLLFRLQAARQEAMTTFQDIALGGEARVRMRAVPRKTTSKEGSVQGSRHITRAERARREAYEAFGGVPLDSLPVGRKRKL